MSECLLPLFFSESRSNSTTKLSRPLPLTLVASQRKKTNACLSYCRARVDFRHSLHTSGHSHGTVSVDVCGPSLHPSAMNHNVSISLRGMHPKFRTKAQKLFPSILSSVLTTSSFFPLLHVILVRISADDPFPSLPATLSESR